jgi:hypothetical protein
MPTPSPSATPTPRPTPSGPGFVHGNYVLQVSMGSDCPAPGGSGSFPVQASIDTTGRYPGVQVVDSLPIPSLELELLDGGTSLRGGIGTTGGVRSQEGTFVWLELVGTGDVSVGSDGVGEVLSGTAVGFVELGANPNDEGGLGTCKSQTHTWSLKRR